LLLTRGLALFSRLAPDGLLNLVELRNALQSFSVNG
jgi:hypothetical protein